MRFGAVADVPGMKYPADSAALLTVMAAVAGVIMMMLLMLLALGGGEKVRLMVGIFEELRGCGEGSLELDVWVVSFIR